MQDTLFPIPAPEVSGVAAQAKGAPRLVLPNRSQMELRPVDLGPTFLQAGCNGEADGAGEPGSAPKGRSGASTHVNAGSACHRAVKLRRASRSRRLLPRRS